jgi:putative MATE family efflux protein
MKNHFYSRVARIALPVALQSLLQSSFSVIDQLMIGQLGSQSIAGVGLGGKFASLYSVLLGAVATAAGIMISQYTGQKNERETSRSFFANTGIAAGVALFFFFVCVFFSENIMQLYTKDAGTKRLAGEYLRIYAFSYLPMALGSITSVLLRCMEAASLPLYASLISVLLNTGLNYLLIFGKGGFPVLGIKGAALATVISQFAACGLILILFIRQYRKQDMRLSFLWRFDRESRVQYLGILCPLLICEFLWSLGENVYAAIYGNMGTDPCAAMTLTIPVQTLLIGALSGISQAAGIMIGKTLGKGEYERAKKESVGLMLLGFGGSLILSLFLIAARSFYAGIFRVASDVQELARQILLAFALIAPVKVQNMILGGGIIRSGGKTKYIMWIDFIGTWFAGVPLGLLAAFVWKLSIPYVYFILSLEECLRWGISMAVFKRGIWIHSLRTTEEGKADSSVSAADAGA